MIKEKVRLRWVNDGFHGLGDIKYRSKSKTKVQWFCEKTCVILFSHSTQNSDTFDTASLERRGSGVEREMVAFLVVCALGGEKLPPIRYDSIGKRTEILFNHGPF